MHDTVSIPAPKDGAPEDEAPKDGAPKEEATLMKSIAMELASIKSSIPITPASIPTSPSMTLAPLKSSIPRIRAPISTSVKLAPPKSSIPRIRAPISTSVKLAPPKSSIPRIQAPASSSTSSEPIPKKKFIPRIEAPIFIPAARPVERPAAPVPAKKNNRRNNPNLGHPQPGAPTYSRHRFVMKYDAPKTPAAERPPSFYNTAVYQSAEFNQLSVLVDFDVDSTRLVRCTVQVGVDGPSVTGAGASSRPIAKQAAMRLAFDELRSCHPTVVVENSAVDDALSRRYFDVVTAHSAIPDDNVGSRLLRKLGWSTGRGLGVNGTGISEPIAESSRRHRRGLGNDGGGDNEFGARITRYLADYAADGSEINDVAFGAEFTKAERATIHDRCARYSLKSRSFGVADRRHLVVTKCRTPAQVVAMVRANGGSTARYKLYEIGETVD